MNSLLQSIAFSWRPPSKIMVLNVPENRTNVYNRYSDRRFLVSRQIFANNDHHSWHSYFNGEVFNVLRYYWYTVGTPRSVFGLPIWTFTENPCLYMGKFKTEINLCLWKDTFGRDRTRNFMHHSTPILNWKKELEWLHKLSSFSSNVSVGNITQSAIELTHENAVKTTKNLLP